MKLNRLGCEEFVEVSEDWQERSSSSMMSPQVANEGLEEQKWSQEFGSQATEKTPLEDVKVFGRSENYFISKAEKRSVKLH